MRVFELTEDEKRKLVRIEIKKKKLEEEAGALRTEYESLVESAASRCLVESSVSFFDDNLTYLLCSNEIEEEAHTCE